jgi:hypothetical protein
MRRFLRLAYQKKPYHGENIWMTNHCLEHGQSKRQCHIVPGRGVGDLSSHWIQTNLKKLYVKTNQTKQLQNF